MPIKVKEYQLLSCNHFMITSVLMFLQFSLSDIEILGLIYLLAVVTYISANRAYELCNHFTLTTLPTNFRILCG